MTPPDPARDEGTSEAAEMNRHPHLDRVYEAELQAIRDHVVDTGARALQMLRDAVAAVLTRDAALARGVVDGDDRVNQLENETDALCVKLLARRAPVGGDLRLVTCALKSVIDLERAGDLAVNIAKRVKDLVAEDCLQMPPEIPELAQGAVDLLDRALVALRDRDAALARTVRVDDARLDALNKAVFRHMLSFAKEHAEQIECALAYTAVSRNLERVGDHAANIAEMVVYLVEGKVLRHNPDDRAA